MVIANVGMAEFKTITNPGVLVTIGLGSCVGIVVYDPVIKCAGMVHIMLPFKPQNKTVTNPAKFADTGIPLLIDELLNLGALKHRLVSKIAGGAQMFDFKQATDIMKIGERNVQATRQTLETLKIPIIAESTGGRFGRTVEFSTITGRLSVKTTGNGVFEI